MDAGLAVVLALAVVAVVGHFLFRDYLDVRVTRASDRVVVSPGPDAPPALHGLWLGESGLGSVGEAGGVGAYGRQARDPVVGRDVLAGRRPASVEAAQARFARRRLTGRLRRQS